MPSYQLLSLPTEAAYRAEFVRVYCDRSSPIFTFDGILVKFFPDMFEHAFFESVRTKDDTFSQPRAERLYWIKDTLEDPDALLLAGYFKGSGTYDHRSRVALVRHDYVVVIQFTSSTTARFVTAYRADQSLRKILGSPNWVSPFGK